MKRNSPKALELVKSVARLGVEVSGRQLESWPNALFPPDDTPPDQFAAGVAAVASVYRPGRGSVDRAVLVVAARGFGCKGLPDAIARNLGAASTDDLEAQASAIAATPTPDPDTDGGSQVIENNARAVIDTAANVDGFGPALDLLKGLLSDTAANARTKPVLDLAALDKASDAINVSLSETPEMTVLSVLDQSYRLIYGGGLTDANTASRVVEDGNPKLDSDGQAALDEIAGGDARAFGVMANLGSIPPWVLAGGAQLMRALLETSGVSNMAGFGDPERLDLLAGTLAPVGLALAPVIYAAEGVDVQPLPTPEQLSELIGPTTEREDPQP